MPSDQSPDLTQGSHLLPVPPLVSGEPPATPVVSKKSGLIYEQRLIQKYIQENGKDPVTGEELSDDDLVEVKPSKYSLSVQGRAGWRIVSNGTGVDGRRREPNKMRHNKRKHISTRSC